LTTALIAGAGAAQADNGSLVVQTSGKLKVTKKIDVDFTCTVNCFVTVKRELKVRGVDPPDSVVNGQFVAGQPARFTLKFNNQARKFIRHDAKKSKLKLTFQVTNTDTGAQDVVKRSFKFKK
jgi:hypothetical protein